MLRTAPGGSSLSLSEILNSYGKSVDLNSLGLKYKFFLVKSGKDALFEAYKASELKEISIPAYSCPDVVTPALKLGIKVNLVDIDPGTLLPVSPCDLLVNLYGLVDGNVQNALFDDACQGGLSFDLESRVGCRGTPFGIFSAGRGKALGAGGGGILAVRKDSFYSTEHLTEVTSLKANSLSSALLAFGYSILERPATFGILSSIPQLKIGETKVQHNFEHGSPAKSQLSWLAMKLSSLSNCFSNNTKLYNELLGEMPSIILPALGRPGQNNTIRYPVVFPDKDMRDKVYRTTCSLGASKSYPEILCNFEGLESLGKSQDYPGASEVAKRILTFPTHRLISRKQIEEVTKKISQCLH